MMGQKEDQGKKESSIKTRDERDRIWNKNLGELNSANAIMRNDLLKMREQLKPLNNQGFNYSDRKTAKGTKIWVKGGREFTDQQLEHDRIDIGKIIREGEICKNVEMISKGIEMI